MPSGFTLNAIVIGNRLMDPNLRVTLLTFRSLQVLGRAEPPHINERVGHQFHAIVPTLDVLKSQQQPLECVLPRKRLLHAIP